MPNRTVSRPLPIPISGISTPASAEKLAPLVGWLGRSWRWTMWRSCAGANEGGAEVRQHDGPESQRPGLMRDPGACDERRHPPCAQARRPACTPWNRALRRVEPEAIGLCAAPGFVTHSSTGCGAFAPPCGRLATYSANHSQRIVPHGDHCQRPGRPLKRRHDRNAHRA